MTMDFHHCSFFFFVSPFFLNKEEGPSLPSISVGPHDENYENQQQEQLTKNCRKRKKRSRKDPDDSIKV